MKSGLIKSLMMIGAVLTVVGCGSGSDSTIGGGNGNGDGAGNGDGPTSELPQNVQDAIAVPKSTLTQDLKDSITYMYNEEGLAYDVYMNIYKIQAVQQLQKIAENAEIKHIDAVNKLAIKYDLNMTTYDPTLEPYSKEGISDGKYSVQHIQNLYDALYPKGIKSKKDALEVGCMVEVVDIVDLEHYIALAGESNASDVLEVFDFLITGSYTHYWSFHDGLVNMGIAEGCCQVTDEFNLGLEFCQPDYPQKKKGGHGNQNLNLDLY